MRRVFCALYGVMIESIEMSANNDWIMAALDIAQSARARWFGNSMLRRTPTLCNVPPPELMVLFKNAKCSPSSRLSAANIQLRPWSWMVRDISTASNAQAPISVSSLLATNCRAEASKPDATSFDGILAGARDRRPRLACGCGKCMLEYTLISHNRIGINA